MYIISRCLLGVNCKYNGENNRSEKVIRFSKKNRYIAVCPECAGGLPTPREPSEIIKLKDQDIRVINKCGIDWTKEFKNGSKISYNEAVKEAKRLGEPIEGAILKSKSPSCGVGRIYDGSFKGRTIMGNGVFADLLIKKSIPVVTEQDFLEKTENKKYGEKHND